MPIPGIEEFGKLLVQNVRDRTIASCKSYLDPDNNTIIAKRWRTGQAGNLNATFDVEAVISDCVDETIFHLLNSIDQEMIPLLIKMEGRTVDLAKDGLGELGGSYVGADGWREKFSKERVFDDFSDAGK